MVPANKKSEGGRYEKCQAFLFELQFLKGGKITHYLFDKYPKAIGDVIWLNILPISRRVELKTSSPDK